MEHIKHWACGSIWYTSTPNFPLQESEEESSHLRQLGDSLLNSVSEVNELEFIDPSDRYVVLKVTCLVYLIWSK